MRDSALKPERTALMMAMMASVGNELMRDSALKRLAGAVAAFERFQLEMSSCATAL